MPDPAARGSSIRNPLRGMEIGNRELAREIVTMVFASRRNLSKRITH